MLIKVLHLPHAGLDSKRERRLAISIPARAALLEAHTALYPPMMFPKSFAALLALALAVPAAAPPAKPWQQFDGCHWKTDRWTDGVSFGVESC